MRKRERSKGFNNLLALMAVCVLFYVLFAYQIRTNVMFRPTPATYSESDDIQWVIAKDGTRLAVRVRKAPGAKRAILYFHDNDEDIGASFPILTSYELQGYVTLCLDYRGFGLTEGDATEENTLSDADAVFEYALNALGFAEKNVALHGRGLGAGVALDLASRRRPGGLIVESAFLSLLRLYLPLRWAPGDRFQNEAKAKRVACPTLVIHGREDKKVPFEHGERLAADFGPGLVRTLWIENAGHDDLSASATSPYWPAIRAFLRDLDAPRR